MRIRAQFIMLFLWLSTIFVMAESQQHIQVMQYVPDRSTGALNTNAQKVPLASVEIEISGSARIVCDGLGRGTLSYGPLKAGDLVNIKEIRKPGYQLFSLRDREEWYVPQEEEPSEVHEILMISDDDMVWLTEQWKVYSGTRHGSRFRYYSPQEHLCCTDMLNITPLQRRVMPLLIAGNLEQVLDIFDHEELLEKLRNSTDEEHLRIEADLQFWLLLMMLDQDRYETTAYQLIQSLLAYKSHLSCLLDYFPTLSHSLRTYEDFDQYIADYCASPHCAAADRAYLLFWKAYNTLNDLDPNYTIRMHKHALSIYDSIASELNNPMIWSYTRGIMCNVIGSQYDKINRREEISQYSRLKNNEEMDLYFSAARRYFAHACEQEPILRLASFSYYSTQAECYWRCQNNVQLVDSLLDYAISISKQGNLNDEKFLSAYLSVLRSKANIELMRSQYEEALGTLAEAEGDERHFFKLHPQLRAEHFAQLLRLKSKVCQKLGKWEEADKAILEGYSAYDIIDRLHPGRYKEAYLVMHLDHAPIRMVLNRDDWARIDLDRAEDLVDELFNHQPERHSSIMQRIDSLRSQLKPRMLNEETVRLRYNPDILELAFITDTHNFGTSADRREATPNIEAFVEYCNSHPAIQVAIHGGDFINAYDTDHERALWCLSRARDQFVGLTIPFYTIKGNHDCNGKQWKDDQRDNSQTVLDREYFPLFSPLSSTNPLSMPEGVIYNPNDPQKNYYYRDFETQRVRLIILNAYSYDKLEQMGFNGEQMRWLAEEALDFSDKHEPSDWSFLILTHTLPTGYNRAIVRFLSQYNNQATEIKELMDGIPVIWRESRQKRAKFIGVLSGHLHADTYNNQNGYNHITVSRGFATGNEVEADPICFDHIIIDTRHNTLTEKRIGQGKSRAFSYGDVSQQTLPSRGFPGLEGLGSYTTGSGQNSTLVQVTNLNDDGEGSLRWAVSQNYSRLVTFKVSGTIRLKSPLVIENDSITIIGHSAPHRQLIIKDAPVIIKSSEVIMRYLTIDPGSYYCDAALLDDHFGQHNIVVDHVTIAPTYGHGIAIRYTEDATVQHCRIYKTLDPEKAALVAGGFKTTYYSNYIDGSNRAIQIPDEMGCNRWIHITRNVVSDWKEAAIFGGGNQGEISVGENYFKPSERTQNRKVVQVSPDGTGRYYVRQNLLKGVTARQQKDLVEDHAGVPWHQPADLDSLMWEKIPLVARPNEQQYSFAASCIVIAAFHYKEIMGESLPLEEMYQYVKSTAGNILKNRPGKMVDKNHDGVPDGLGLYDWLLMLEPIDNVVNSR